MLCTYHLSEFSRENEKIFVQKSRLYIENQLPEHIHSDFIEILYVLEGCGYHIAAGEKHNVQKGDLLFLSHLNSHTMCALSNDFLWVDIGFQPKFLDDALEGKYSSEDLLSLDLFNDYKGLRLLGMNDIILKDVQTEFEYLVLEMHNEYMNEQNGYLKNLKYYLIVLLSKIFRCKKGSKGPRRYKTDAFVNLVTNELIAYNYRNIDMAKIARRFCMSYKYFSRVFKEHVGMRFTEFLHKKQIEKACEQLVNSQDSVSDICVKVGFNDEKAFYRNFKEITGRTPGQYRKEYKR